MSLDRLAALLDAMGVEATSRELADTVWLAVHMGASPDITAEHHPTPVSAPPLTGPETPPGGRPAHVPPPEVPGSGVGPAEPTAHLPGNGESTVGGRAAVPLRVPAAPALPRPLELMRALRPLKREVPSCRGAVLDEDATADRVADERVWLPVLRPAAERWLDLALVVDTSPSMVIWQTLADEIRAMLESLGAFRSVDVWHLAADSADGQERLGVRRAASLRDPRELVDATGRRAVLLFSDCVGAPWRNGSATDLLAMWGRAGPVAILQPLPESLWRRSALVPRAVRLHAGTPGLPNDRLRWRARTRRRNAGPVGVPVPVLELRPQWFASWASLVAGVAGDGIDAAVVFTDSPARAVPSARVVAAGPDPVSRFREAASPEAFALARSFAASPLNLPVMRLIQHVTVPRTGPAHLAEVFLGGLLRRVPGQPTDLPPDRVHYDFVAGARDTLLDTQRRDDIVRVLHEVSRFVGDRIGVQSHDFTALLTAPAELPDATAAVASPGFAAVTAHVLRRLGGRYADLADTFDSDGRVAAPALADRSSESDVPQVPPTTGRVPNPLQLLGIEDASDMDLAVRWRQRDDRDRLRVPIGVDPTGRQVDLDLKDTSRGGMGSYGLVAGAPGRGKARILRNLVIALAATHPPDEIQFLLVHGRTFNPFGGHDRLPHVVHPVMGSNSNDGSWVDDLTRTLDAERGSRYALLRESGHSNHDAYRRARLAGRSLAPMPTVLVACYDFDGLIEARPDAYAVFSAIGQVGGTLGIHLLIASPRPESLWLDRYLGRSPYRVVLRTVTGEDSSKLLRTPDAADLPHEPGHGYLKVGDAPPARFYAAMLTSVWTDLIDTIAAYDQTRQRPQAPTTRVFAGHAGAVLSCAVAPDGTWLATTGQDGTVRVWDVETGADRLLAANLGPAMRCTLSPDGRLLAVAGTLSGQARIWDTDTWQLRPGFASGWLVRKCVVAPDGTWMATMGGDRVAIWNTATGEQQRALLARTRVHDCVVGSGWFAIAGNSGVSVWDARSGDRLAALGDQSNQFRALAVTADSRWLAATGRDGAVTIWDTTTWERDRVVRSSGEEVVDCAFSPDGAWLVSVSLGTAVVWDTATGQLRERFQHGSAVHACVVAPDGTFLVTAGSDGAARTWPMPVAERAEAPQTTPQNQGVPPLRLPVAPDNRHPDPLQSNVDSGLRMLDLVPAGDGPYGMPQQPHLDDEPPPAGDGPVKRWWRRLAGPPDQGAPRRSAPSEGPFRADGADVVEWADEGSAIEVAGRAVLRPHPRFGIREVTVGVVELRTLSLEVAYTSGARSESTIGGDGVATFDSLRIQIGWVEDGKAMLILSSV